MADEETEPTGDAAPEEPVTPPAGDEAPADKAPAVEEPPAESPPAEDPPAEEPPAEEPPAEEPPAEEPPAEEPPAAAEKPAEEPAAATEKPAEAAKPAIPGADLEVDIVPEGSDPLLAEQAEGEAGEEGEGSEGSEEAAEARPEAKIDLGADARYTATGKRKTAIARVILRPGKGEYTINGKPLNDHFPRPTLQRNIRQPLETVGYEARMDVVAKLHGGGISAQAGALRHGISRALIEADPNLRIELKRRGFLTRDPRVKERKKAGLKKARKRPQFSKR
jgi:small subunit ribosomal protein S9